MYCEPGGTWAWLITGTCTEGPSQQGIFTTVSCGPPLNLSVDGICCTCPAGSTLLEFASLVHRDFAEKLKSARIWGTGVFDGQTVTREHVMQDKDVVELHT